MASVEIPKCRPMPINNEGRGGGRSIVRLPYSGAGPFACRPKLDSLPFQKSYIYCFLGVIGHTLSKGVGKGGLGA